MQITETLDNRPIDILTSANVLGFEVSSRFDQGADGERLEFLMSALRDGVSRVHDVSPREVAFFEDLYALPPRESAEVEAASPHRRAEHQLAYALCDDAVWMRLATFKRLEKVTRRRLNEFERGVGGRLDLALVDAAAEGIASVWHASAARPPQWLRDSMLSMTRTIAAWAANACPVQVSS